MNYNPWRTATYFLMLVIVAFSGFYGSLKPTGYNPIYSLNFGLFMMLITALIALVDMIPKFLKNK